ncbi:predicted protein [Sclerotinia sclerotiorum 1980 UF-70]|uniref:Uncharacterized protein n=1 Tax=Sclerotinia sclerotiorum (strain ATCC 18683 / 1980 / Ss-1) TaxID=665079 RepID=A7F086_SCLS1|nr:predicted protein [Sclerotinia sclerotiorum 1980 UF-70]EDN95128.1 predicted protein [Sclerotinia sclerotiorum 1980 UF-70]
MELMFPRCSPEISLDAGGVKESAMDSKSNGNVPSEKPAAALERTEKLQDQSMHVSLSWGPKIDRGSNYRLSTEEQQFPARYFPLHRVHTLTPIHQKTSTTSTTYTTHTTHTPSFFSVLPEEEVPPL